LATDPGGRPLPQSVEAEASLLGALLLDASLLEVVRSQVLPDDLSRETHRAIYRAIIELADSGREPSFAAVTELLRAKSELDEAGGPAAIVGLIEGTPSPAHARGYAAVVERTSILRRIIGAAQDMMRLALSSGEPRAAVEQAQQLLFRVSERRLHREVVTLREALDDYFATIDEQNEQGRGPALSTRFASLDTLLGGGLHPGDLVIVAGRPGMGKTSFALNVMRNAALQHDAVAAVFSLEMTEEDLTLRLLSGLAEIDGGRLRRGSLDVEELKAINHASGELMQHQIFIEECTRLDVTDVLTHARKLQVRQGRLDLIVIDYLQLMEGLSGDEENRVQEVASITRGLKAIARELEVPVLVISQLSRQIERRTGGEPKLSDLRECVTGDTRVIDAETGRLTPVLDLRAGARILALGDDHRVGPFQVADVWSTGVKPVFRVTSQTGRTIRATANHPFLTPTGWRPLEGLSRGDLVGTPMRLSEVGVEWPEANPRELRVPSALSMRRSTVGKYAELTADPVLRTFATSDVLWEPVRSVEPAGEEAVFDLRVPGSGNFIADGFVVHNSGAIEQDADVVIFLWKRDRARAGEPIIPILDVRVAKHRHGPTGDFQLYFDYEYTRFRELTTPAA